MFSPLTLMNGIAFDELFNTNMLFNITINPKKRYDPVVLYCYNGGTELRFTFQDINGIKNFNLETDTRLIVDNGHSVHTLYWNETYVTFDCTPEEEDWEETLFVVVRNNPETLKSLKKCLKIWKKKAEGLHRA